MSGDELAIRLGIGVLTVLWLFAALAWISGVGETLREIADSLARIADSLDTDGDDDPEDGEEARPSEPDNVVLGLGQEPPPYEPRQIRKAS